MTGPERIARYEKQPASPDLDPDPRVPDNDNAGSRVGLNHRPETAGLKPYRDASGGLELRDAPSASGINPRDVDPRMPDEWWDEFVDSALRFAPPPAVPPPASSRLLGLLIVALSAALVAGLLGFAAGRLSAAAPGSAAPAITAWQPIEAPPGVAGDTALTTARPSWRPEVAAGGASPSPAVGSHPILDVPIESMPATSDIGTAIEGGTASFVGPKYGSRYLALPEGPGVTVRICAGSRCVTRTSTDAGPDKAMQRAGRVADLSWADFRTLCGGCDPYVVGLLRVTVERGGPSVTPPATDR